MTERSRMLALIAAAVVLTGCGGEVPAVSSSVPRSTIRPRPLLTSIPGQATTPAEPLALCSAEFPFQPTYLPEGFDAHAVPGPAPGAPEPDRSRGQVVLHYQGRDGSAVEFRRPGTLFVELALADDAPTIEVLGAPANDAYPVGRGSSVYIVQFGYPPGQRSEESCSLFSVDGYGLTRDEVRRVAQGLVSAG